MIFWVLCRAWFQGFGGKGDVVWWYTEVLVSCTMTVERLPTVLGDWTEYDCVFYVPYYCFSRSKKIYHSVSFLHFYQFAVFFFPCIGVQYHLWYESWFLKIKVYLKIVFYVRNLYYNKIHFWALSRVTQFDNRYLILLVILSIKRNSNLTISIWGLCYCTLKVRTGNLGA